VEHERRLVQATDGLLIGVSEGAPEPADRPAPPLALVTEAVPDDEPPPPSALAVGAYAVVVVAVLASLVALVLGLAGAL
jgi:hypothetical protein